MSYILRCFLFLVLFFCILTNSKGQTSNISGIINNYASVTGIGSQSVSLSSTIGFVSGDRVLLIQMKGAEIDTSNTASFGTINSYHDAGNYEMLTISSISSTTITFATPILRTYNTSGLVQLVKVPVYNNVNVTGILTCAPWSGSTGGILIFEATGNITLNANIDVTGKGFLGGAKLFGQLSSCAGNTSDFKLPNTSVYSASKGEGITLMMPSFMKGLGALGNGGGAGNDANGGGAGGGNFGLGGHGGNAKCSTSPLSLCGGYEGKNCTYSNVNNKIFLGGGGGAGHENDGVSTAGVSGGGIIIIRSGGSISGNGNFINSNGNDNNVLAGNDGQGGGGAGGTILIEACSTSSLTISAKGGKGGTDNFIGPDCHGKGGGGGGGIIWTTSTLAYSSILIGGNPGVFTDASSQCFNTSNGATAGQAGGTLTGLVIPGALPLIAPSNSFTLNTSSNCVSNTATATGTLSTTLTSPIVSYSWTNSSGTIISQTNNTSSLSNSVNNLTNGVYTLSVTLTTPCTTLTGSQTLTITCVATPTQPCGGTLTGTGMSICNQYSFSITSTQTITPLNYGSQGYACTGATMPDVSFTTMGGGWRVMKNNWNFVSTVNGQVSGYNSSGVFQIFPFSATNTITPLSYSGTFVQFAINGVATGQLLNQATFSISLNPNVFGSNSYTYCASTATSIAISPTVPVTGGPWNYNWQPGNMSGNPISVSPSANTVYTVNATSIGGCVSSTTIAVTATCVSTPTAPQCPGSLLFDAAHPAVTLPVGNQYYSDTNGGYTWECWFKLNQPFGNDMRALISSVDGVLYEDQWFGFGWQGGWFNEPVTKLVFKVDGPNSVAPTGPNCAYAPPGGFVLGTWYHAAGVMDYINQSSYLYVNGALVDSKPITTPPITRVISTQLCLNWGGTPLPLNGNMDEVRIWERPLSASEISLNYDKCLSGTESNLLVYYRCNQPGGTTVTDASPNNNTGVFSNAPSWSSQQPNVSGLACANGINLSVTSTPTICAGSTATLTANGASTYTWSNNATTSTTTVNPLVTTSYTVDGSNGSCSSQSVITVSVVPSVTLSITGNTLICSGQTTTLTANGASNYIWNSGLTTNSISVSPITTTIYSVSASGVCSNTTVATVSVIAVPSLTLSPNANICQGANSSATLTASGANTYTWTNPSTLSSSTGSMVVASPNTTTSYTVTGSNTACTNTSVVTVSVNPSPTITATSINNTTCGLTNGSATVTSAPAGNTYTWSSGVVSVTNTASSLAPGNYTVTAIGGACQTTTVITILSSVPLSITGSTITPTHCNVNDGSISVSDNLLGSSYNWIPSVSTSNNASNLAIGNYSLTITNGACTTSSVFIVSQLNGPTSIAIIQNNAICESNGNIKITNVVNGLTPYQYSFNNSGFSSTTNYTNLSQGIYTVAVKDANNCLYTQTLSIAQTTINSTIALTTNTPNCESNDGVFIIDSIMGGTPPYQTSFNNTAYSSNMTFEQLSTGTYTLSILDSNLCETGFLLVMPENNKDFTLYIPNTFTPNKDKVNDIWYVQGTCLGEFSCLIYNRWGERIKELHDIKEGWDGTYRGTPVPDGVYVYLVEVSTKEGIINKAGHITLFR